MAQFKFPPDLVIVKYIDPKVNRLKKITLKGNKAEDFQKDEFEKKHGEIYSYETYIYWKNTPILQERKVYCITYYV